MVRRPFRVGAGPAPAKTSEELSRDDKPSSNRPWFRVADRGGVHHLRHLLDGGALHHLDPLQHRPRHVHRSPPQLASGPIAPQHAHVPQPAHSRPFCTYPPGSPPESCITRAHPSAPIHASSRPFPPRPTHLVPAPSAPAPRHLRRHLPLRGADGLRRGLVHRRHRRQRGLRRRHLRLGPRRPARHRPPRVPPGRPYTFWLVCGTHRQ